MNLLISKNYAQVMGLTIDQKINLKGQREQILYFLHNCKKRVSKSNKNFYSKIK